MNPSREPNRKITGYLGPAQEVQITPANVMEGKAYSGRFWKE
jgi:hypothetical protein